MEAPAHCELRRAGDTAGRQNCKPSWSGEHGETVHPSWCPDPPQRHRSSMLCANPRNISLSHMKKGGQMLTVPFPDDHPVLNECFVG
jgi:hypothetical protein